MAEHKIIKVGLVQMSCTENPAANVKKAVEGIRSAAGKGANIVCLQELFRSLYFCVKEDYSAFGLAEPIPGSTTEQFQSLAKELGVVLIAPLFEKRAEGVYHNSAAIIDADGSYLGKYRKMHIPDDPSFYEKFYFTPGDLGFKSWKTRFGTIGILICWDQWYPEAARLTALSGAEILFYPTAIGWDENEKAKTREEQFQAWQLIQRSHAVANGIPVVSVNRVGKEGNLEFWGASFVANTFGEVLFQSSHDKEEVSVVDIDLNRSNLTRTHWPFLRDRRIDAYGGMTSRMLDE
ncbi:MAG TPA: carbon-nitrogen hydrolase [Bacteroidota bacterium]|nr:carbon-nitrogen hydrolase [Bacteroidota bacterium]